MQSLAIIGGGLVGASLALALQEGARERGWRIHLIEPFEPGHEYQPSYDARSTALSYGTRLIYQRLGLISVWACGTVSPSVPSRFCASTFPNAAASVPPGWMRGTRRSRRWAM